MNRERWTDMNFARDHMLAQETLKRDPAALTDEQIQVLDDYDDGGPLYRRQRSAAQLAKLPKPQPMTAATSGGVTALQVKNAIAKVYETVGEGFDVVLQQAVKPMRAQIKALEASNAALESQVAELQQKQGITGLRWAGAYEAGKVYYEGECCQRNHLWLCIVPQTKAQPGMSPEDWKCIVHNKHLGPSRE